MSKLLVLADRGKSRKQQEIEERRLNKKTKKTKNASVRLTVVAPEITLGEFELRNMKSRLSWVILVPLMIFPSWEIFSAQDNAEAKRLYATYCSNCHGVSGKGDGLAAKSLPVKPANHTDGQVMGQFSDKYLHDIISKGGSGVGKSSFMPGWGSLLKDQQIRKIISYMRSLSIPPSQSPGE